MAIIKRRNQHVRGNIVFMPIDEISPNPAQPRKRFDLTKLKELAASIDEHGVLQPLTVRIRNDGYKLGYELISGERRLRASSMAGLSEVPCIILDVNMEESTLIALVENLQRSDLDVIEEAEGIAQLIRMFGMKQEEAARRLGKSQSSIANKLRLLKLPSDVLERIRDEGLGERHGRALLRLMTAEAQRAALDYIVEQRLNVAATESFVEYLMNAPDEEPSEFLELSADCELSISTEPSERKQKTKLILKDVRVFLNSLSRGLTVMKQGGIDVAMDQTETETDLILTINIPKNSHPN